jgi:hypothetical protein
MTTLHLGILLLYVPPWEPGLDFSPPARFRFRPQNCRHFSFSLAPAYSQPQRCTDRCLTHELVFFDVFLPEVVLGMTHFFSFFFTFFQYLGKKRRKTPRYLRVFFSRVDSREICETKGKNASGIKTPEYSRPVVFFYKSSIWTLENIENVVSAVFYEKVSQI